MTRTRSAWSSYYLGARARAGGPASRGCPGRAAGRDAPARPVARWPLVLSVSVPDGECIVVVGIVWSACAALRDKLLATHGTAWNQTRRPEPRYAGALAGMPATRARTGEAGAARRGHRRMAHRGAAVARRRQSRARTRPSANGQRLRWCTHARVRGFLIRKSRWSPSEKRVRKVACVGCDQLADGTPRINVYSP